MDKLDNLMHKLECAEEEYITSQWFYGTAEQFIDGLKNRLIMESKAESLTELENELSEVVRIIQKTIDEINLAKGAIDNE